MRRLRLGKRKESSSSCIVVVATEFLQVKSDFDLEMLLAEAAAELSV